VLISAGKLLGGERKTTKAGDFVQENAARYRGGGKSDLPEVGPADRGAARTLGAGLRA
jgi:hypothetical protein